MTQREQMTVKASALYSQWNRTREVTLNELKEVLHYFERYNNVDLSSTLDNVNSKMKLIFNLSGQYNRYNRAQP